MNYQGGRERNKPFGGNPNFKFAFEERVRASWEPSFLLMPMPSVPDFSWYKIFLVQNLPDFLVQFFSLTIFLVQILFLAHPSDQTFWYKIFSRTIFLVQILFLVHPSSPFLSERPCSEFIHSYPFDFLLYVCRFVLYVCRLCFRFLLGNGDSELSVLFRTINLESNRTIFHQSRIVLYSVLSISNLPYYQSRQGSAFIQSSVNVFMNFE